MIRQVTLVLKLIWAKGGSLWVRVYDTFHILWSIKSIYRAVWKWCIRDGLTEGKNLSRTSRHLDVEKTFYKSVLITVSLISFKSHIHPPIPTATTCKVYKVYLGITWLWVWVISYESYGIGQYYLHLSA